MVAKQKLLWIMAQPAYIETVLVV